MAEIETPKAVKQTFEILKTDVKPSERAAATAATMNVAAQHHAATGVETPRPNFFQKLFQRITGH